MDFEFIYNYRNGFDCMKKILGILIVSFVISATFVLYRFSEYKLPSALYQSKNNKEFLNVSEEPLMTREDIENECRHYAYKDGVVENDLNEYLDDCIQDILKQENQEVLPSKRTVEIYRT